MDKNHSSVPAVVLGMAVTGLAVVRALGRQGIRVYALDPDPHKPALKTKYADCRVCPDALRNPDEFKKFLSVLIKEIGPGAVLLPTNDNFNDFVNRNQDELKKYFKFIMTEKSVMDKLMDKKGQSDLAEAAGVPMPKTFYPKHPEEIQRIADEVRYPVIIKGLTTSLWRQKYGDKKGMMASNKNELIKEYGQIHQAGIDCVVQEIIKGDDQCHYKLCAYINEQGETLLTFTLQKIRQYPCHFGIGSSIVSIKNQEVADLGLRFMKAVHYRGVGSIEFKKDVRDGKYYMIEMNPRFWAQNGLTERCGQNFALTAYKDILGEKIEPKTDFEENVKWIAFKEDRASFYGYRKEGVLTWGRWLASVFSGKKIWALWSADDPMPFFHEIKFGFSPFEKIFRKVFR